MKRLRSTDDLKSFGEKSVFKDWGRRDDETSLGRSSSQRNFNYSPQNGRKVQPTFSSRYDRFDDDRENPRFIRKRSDYETEGGYDRRAIHDRYRDVYNADRIHRSESFSLPRREIPKGVRSERDRPRGEGSVSSWRRIGKDIEDGSCKVVSEDKSYTRVPQRSRDSLVKSPPCSKDSGSEQSKSIRTTRTEDTLGDSGSSSEMEEGELEPEPETVAEAHCLTGSGPNHNERKMEEYFDNKVQENEVTSVSLVKINKDGIFKEKREDGVKPVPEVKSGEDGGSDEKPNFESERRMNDLTEAVDESTNSERNSVQRICVRDDVAENPAVIRESNEEKSSKENHSSEKRESENEVEEQKIKNLEIEVSNSNFPTSSNKGVWEGTGVTVVALSVQADSVSQRLKDKGKSVVVSFSSSNATDLAEEETKAITESSLPFTCEGKDMEGLSSRGFDLFLNHPVKQPERKVENGKLELEPLDLSLSLPNVLLPIDSQNRALAPCSPTQARSIQSIPSTFRTNSDGFTASMSFSGSQSFRHNPSCSLNNFDLDNFERSVSSRPLFGGADQVSGAILQGQPLTTEGIKKDIPIYQKVLPNGNDLRQSNQQLKVTEGSSAKTEFDRQLSLHRQLSMNSRQPSNEESPQLSVGSHGNKSENSRGKTWITKERVTSTMCKSNVRNGELVVNGGVDSVESIVTMIVSEPVHVMARKFIEMNGQAITRLKEGVRDIIVNASKQWQLSLFQKALNNRSDITLEMLLKANRIQLEIFVALKTGVGEFVRMNHDISSSDMAEIYVNLRCRNITCRHLLPVDDCECKVCAQKNGFCSSCMCLVCSKFDMASNTCSWVGCDVCLHWCHVDCAIRESYIRNGRSASGAHGLREMQFHCVACDHPSEMFGFVKEVFQTFAKEWTAENLFNELEFVKKIFSASEDMRGKRMHDLALLMLNKSDIQEVRNQIMGFLAESGSMKSDDPTVRSGKELFDRNQEANIKTGGPSQEALWLKPLYSEKVPQLEKIPSIKFHQKDNKSTDLHPQRSAPKGHAFDELESIVRIKDAEAKMFQTRADDARREAEGLKRIAAAKNQKMEEDFMSRVSKLRVPEAEEVRKQKIEELQVLEKACVDYCNMKMRMEGDIKDLLSKMEATRRSLAM